MRLKRRHRPFAEEEGSLLPSPPWKKASGGSTETEGKAEQREEEEQFGGYDVRGLRRRSIRRPRRPVLTANRVTVSPSFETYATRPEGRWPFVPDCPSPGAASSAVAGRVALTLTDPASAFRRAGKFIFDSPRQTW
ncbi:hypothetical protein GUJ93_ZPchr0006g42480 [Zizania palustris]|uniref:Uncharacterized protein n=1 Tax=Zizania palustris TaxID=103762 RepID=A0A8J5T2V6_ZIZPA|nr:hypothetical protein GUJ93_ZPchr0006g42480 [Zizania palustris]